MNFRPDFVRNFWQRRAETGATRWTTDEFFKFEQDLLLPYVAEDSSILDLGSGFGELSRSICPVGGNLTAVDHIYEYSTAFNDEPRFQFVQSSVDTFQPETAFDVILLFGVVTHLTSAQEKRTYQIIRSALKPGGTAFIKNQCSDEDDLWIDTYSEALQSDYQARYPSIANQERFLRESFRVVTSRIYPLELKTHPNTSHVIFSCSM